MWLVAGSATQCRYPAKCVTFALHIIAMTWFWCSGWRHRGMFIVRGLFYATTRWNANNSNKQINISVLCGFDNESQFSTEKGNEKWVYFCLYTLFHDLSVLVFLALVEYSRDWNICKSVSSSTGRLNDYCVGKGSDPGRMDMARTVMSKESATIFLIAGRLYDWTMRPIGLAAFSDAAADRRKGYVRTLWHPPSILEDFPLSQFACNIRQVNLTFKSVSTPFWQKYSGVVVVASKHPSVCTVR